VLAGLGFSSFFPSAFLSHGGLTGSDGSDGGGVSLFSSVAILKLGNQYLLEAKFKW
jgi:GTPase involved in cell partitioning and DNA repair